MHCPRCGFANPEGMNFCGHCGTALREGCPHCGFESPPGFAFCGKCGAPLTGQPPAPAPASLAPQPQTPFTYTPHHLAEKILTSRRTLEGERKQVTVLFADLKGSMELLAERDPEEARQLLDPVLERLMAAVHRFEGTVNQVLGDGIMALFGAPIAHEDHALRACYAALAMQEAIQHYSAQVRRAHGLEVQIRVGLNSGEVVVRAIGNDLHMDYSAIGQTTHLAARMEQLATPGSIRMTAATLRLVEGLVRVNALGPVPVKRLTEPVEMVELVGASGIRRRLQAAVARGLTRFVGRETEIETLRHALERAGAGHGQVVAVVGEAGVGKSRLAYELVHSHRTQGWLVLESASVSYGTATPYFPVMDLLKRYAHVEDEEEPRAIRAKVTGQVLTLDETLQETLPALLALLREAEALARALDDRARLARVLAVLTHVLMLSGDLAEALAAGQQALAFTTGLGNLALQVEASYRLGMVYWAVGDYERAAELFRRNVKTRDPGAGSPDRLYQIDSLAFLALTLSDLGQFTEGRRHGEEALRLATVEGRAGEPMNARWCLGRLYLTKGDLAAAISLLDQGLALCRATGNRQWEE